jgi:hypothetical protein
MTFFTDNSTNIGTSPVGLVLVSLFLILYYSLVDTSNSNENMVKRVANFALWILFVIFLFLYGMSFIFGIDVIYALNNHTLISSLDGSKSNIALVDDDSSNTGYKPIVEVSDSVSKVPQVYHVPDNKYNFQEGKAICAAFNGRLASFKEIDEAYGKGADWCSYGWSEGQMALYPTQYERWNRLQTQKGHENDCGHPGINGGYMGNPANKYGVNCFGVKPLLKPNDEYAMSNALTSKNADEIVFDKHVEHWRKRIDDIVVAPFNPAKWSL